MNEEEKLLALIRLDKKSELPPSIQKSINEIIVGIKKFFPLSTQTKSGLSSFINEQPDKNQLLIAVFALVVTEYPHIRELEDLLRSKELEKFWQEIFDQITIGEKKIGLARQDNVPIYNQLIGYFCQTQNMHMNIDAPFLEKILQVGAQRKNFSCALALEEEKWNELPKKIEASDYLAWLSAEESTMSKLFSGLYSSLTLYHDYGALGHLVFASMCLRVGQSMRLGLIDFDSEINIDRSIPITEKDELLEKTKPTNYRLKNTKYCFNFWGMKHFGLAKTQLDSKLSQEIIANTYPNCGFYGGANKFFMPGNLPLFDLKLGQDQNRIWDQAQKLLEDQFGSAPGKPSPQ